MAASDSTYDFRYINSFIRIFKVFVSVF